MNEIFILLIFLLPIPGIVNVQKEQHADVLSVIVTGSEGNYSFKVKIRSPDKDVYNMPIGGKSLIIKGSCYTAEYCNTVMLANNHLNVPVVRSVSVRIVKSMSEPI